ncbi:hypothetical protein HJG60_008337 [Phyllostomus discolor]|uniref:Uncharacterized protein n=1 Tax=Phyllostomus discolor TaxID=89673 RepID=A0A833Z9I4_9CHIR|nr:hypothetical protein HJG60_008337 [Phyllostomus discolor]
MSDLVGPPYWGFHFSSRHSCLPGCPPAPQRGGTPPPHAGRSWSLCPVPPLAGAHWTLASSTRAEVRMPPEASQGMGCLPLLFPGKPLAGNQRLMKTQRPFGEGGTPEFISLLANLQTSAPPQRVPETAHGPSCSLSVALGPTVGAFPPTEGGRGSQRPRGCSWAVGSQKPPCPGQGRCA